MQIFQTPLQQLSHAQFEYWENELHVHGFIENESSLLQIIKNLDLQQAESRQKAAHLLTIVARSFAAKGKRESFILALMEKAEQYDPDNKKAKAYLACFEWKNYKTLLNELTFPPLRETDNRQAKNQTMDVYILTCQNFLKTSDEHLKKLAGMTNSPYDNTSDKSEEALKNIIVLLENVTNEIVSLLQSVTAYKESLVGTFHTAVYLEDIKKHLSRIEELKSQWVHTFAVNNQEITVDEKNQTALEELNEMIGLESIKSRVNDFYQFFKYQKLRKEHGFRTKDEVSLNMIITGNPGTGKTSLARLFAKIYHELGVLPRAEVIEKDRSQLVGAYVGQTEENVRSAVEEALGGVLFIDEAYNLKREGQAGNDYGQTAIDTLVSLMTSSEYGGRFAVILAGYPEEMRPFLDANPGLRSRFPTSNFITLPNYTNQELIEIGEKLAEDNDYMMTNEAKSALEDRIEKERVDDSFGNARTVRNLVLDAIFKKGAKFDRDDLRSILDFSLLDQEDFILEQKEMKKNPQENLLSLIGLNNVKEEVTSIISFVKMQKLRREHGLPVLPIQLHTVFTGNPGTGKTTVAKIYAELLKECGLLKRGHLITTSRADFVAGYVGQTALKTKRKIRDALGGVLFIDEAYSLLGKTAGDFGKEVIDTLVDEMTKHDENLVVILAGYSNEMKLLLESNPGLKSRFKKFIHFPDYSAQELLQIMKLYGNQFNYHLTEDAEKFILEKLSSITVSGNGRFAVNLLNETIQAQAHRLMGESDSFPLLDKAMIMEKEDAEKAFNKLGRGE